MAWLLLASGPGDPAFNMAMDEALLVSMPRLQTPVLRFYSWTIPAASFGYFQKYSEVERTTHRSRETFRDRFLHDGTRNL